MQAIKGIIFYRYLFFRGFCQKKWVAIDTLTYCAGLGCHYKKPPPAGRGTKKRPKPKK
jgi:hypothetical protein